jgi:8-oxo-dGTP diphosphatase
VIRTSSQGPPPRTDEQGRPAVALERPIPVGIGVIRRGDCFLIRQRPPGTAYAGYWEFPGGKCQPGEEPAQATARECLEEIGLPITVGALLRVVTHQYPHGLVRLFFFDCVTRNPPDEPLPGSGFQWVNAAELPSLRFPEANEPLLADLATASRDLQSQK